MINITDITAEKIEELKHDIINLLRDSTFFYNDAIYNYNIPEMLTTMFEYIHLMYYKKSYDYMFHWANKCGGWVDTDWYDNYLNGKIEQRKKIVPIENKYFDNEKDEYITPEERTNAIDATIANK